MRAVNPAQRLLDRLEGEPIRWFRSVGRCPCWNPADGTHDANHTLCGGSGFLRQEVDVSAYRAIVVDPSSSRNFGQDGLITPGTVTCSTWPNEIPLGPDDRVILINRVRIDNETLTRGSTLSDSLAHEYVQSVSALYTKNGAMTTGWSLVGNSIVWSAGAAPAAGERYSVKLTYSPIWQVTTDPATQRATDPDGTPRPQRVTLAMHTAEIP